MLLAVLLLGAVSTAAPAGDRSAEPGIQSMLNEESPDVFLAKVTLQQYLSRVVRKDWGGVRRLTHPKTLAVIAHMKRRTGVERHNLAPWANRESELKTFRFTGARQVSPGAVLLQVGEDSYRVEEQGMSVDDPAVYLMFKSRGGFLVADKKAGVELSDVSDQSVRIGYPRYVDQQVQAQARRESALFDGKHR
ncbi:MAG TPA: hypothetical protein VE755_02455 [Myxococcales bacterium]|nr:hypothetical protein [Myxococcales bacterium]